MTWQPIMNQPGVRHYSDYDEKYTIVRLRPSDCTCKWIKGVWVECDKHRSPIEISAKGPYKQTFNR